MLVYDHVNSIRDRQFGGLVFRVIKECPIGLPPHWLLAGEQPVLIFPAIQGYPSIVPDHPNSWFVYAPCSGGPNHGLLEVRGDDVLDRTFTIARGYARQGRRIFS